MQVLDRPKIAFAGSNVRRVSTPSGVGVEHTTIEAVGKGKSDCEIVVFQFKKSQAATQIREFAEAFKQVLNDSNQFFVINLEGAGHVSAELYKSILDYFPYPERIEFTTSKEKLSEALETLTAKVRLLCERNVASSPRVSSLDQVRDILAATGDLRTDSGRLSAKAVSDVFGLTDSELARFLGKSRQTLSKTPDSEALQQPLNYFERVARLRKVTNGDVGFRKWLRTANPALSGKRPLEFLASDSRQVVADLVDDILTGTPG